MNKNQNGITAPASSPATLAHSRPVSAKAREILSDQSNGLPVYIRAPKQGVEFYTGASRAKLYEWAAKGLIRSVSIREPGQIKGTRVFLLQSIFDLYAKCEGEAQ